VQNRLSMSAFEGKKFTAVFYYLFVYNEFIIWNIFVDLICWPFLADRWDDVKRMQWLNTAEKWTGLYIVIYL